MFKKIIIDANITLLTPGTKGSITGGPGCQSMLAGLYFSKTGYINTYNNSLLKGTVRRNFSNDSKFNKNDQLQKPSENQIINPFFFTGFVDGEGCFSLSIVRNNKFKVGWRVNPFFFNSFA